MVELARFEGIQFIGDPHVSSRRPGRRKEGYTESVLAKLERCAELSREHRWVSVITGDLFHTSRDSDLAMLSRLIQVLRSFYAPVRVLTGNHDLSRDALSDADALSLLFLAGAAVPLTDETVEIGSDTVRILGVDYGTPIPDRIESYGTAAVTCLVTHHDLAFGSAYPGALPLKSIAGVDFVVNGHMHATKPAQLVGSTWWHNPGNIEPLSIDLRAHLPACWVWAERSDCSQLKRHELPHDFDCFDLTGLRIAAGDSQAAVAELEADAPVAGAGNGSGAEAAQTLPVSEFALGLAEEGKLSAVRTDDASVLAEDLTEVLNQTGASPATSALLNLLLKRVGQGGQPSA